LTYLDACAALPENARTDDMIARADAIRDLLANLYEMGMNGWKHEATDIIDRYSNCEVYMLLQRQLFYRARSLAAPVLSIMARMREDFDISADWGLDEELPELRTPFHDEHDRVMEALLEEVELE
jgi:hypothetical protein